MCFHNLDHLCHMDPPKFKRGPFMDLRARRELEWSNTSLGVGRNGGVLYCVLLSLSLMSKTKLVGASRLVYRVGPGSN